MCTVVFFWSILPMILVCYLLGPHRLKKKLIVYSHKFHGTKFQVRNNVEMGHFLTLHAHQIIHTCHLAAKTQHIADMHCSRRALAPGDIYSVRV